MTRSNSGGLCNLFQSRMPGVAAPAVLHFGQPSRPALRPAKPLIELTVGGPKVVSDYREWAEPLHGGLMDVRDGSPQGMPIRRPGTCYAVRTEGETLQVAIPA